MRDDVGQGAAHDGGPEVAQLAKRRGVEGARLGLGDAKLGQAVAHLEGRALRERHGQHVGGVESPHGRTVGDAIGDCPRLTRSGAGEDGEWPGDLRGDGSLVGV